MRWDGSLDLEAEFAVVDADTGAPVEGAAISVVSHGGLYAKEDEDRDAEPFVLRTDGAGSARRECHRNACSGTRSGLGVTSTHAVHLPDWRYRVTAAGYEPTAEEHIDVLNNRKAVRQTGHRQAEVQVRVPLRKAAN
jgi:hypothetical protein